MGLLKLYKCNRKRCGYSVKTEAQGHYALMYTDIYNFRCDKCREIIELSVVEFASRLHGLRCNRCGADSEHLFPWNPTEGKCPKCRALMSEDTSFVGLLVD